MMMAHVLPMGTVLDVAAVVDLLSRHCQPEQQAPVPQHAHHEVVHANSRSSITSLSSCTFLTSQDLSSMMYGAQLSELGRSERGCWCKKGTSSQKGAPREFGSLASQNGHLARQQSSV